MRNLMTSVIVATVLILALVVGVNAQAVATNFTWVVTKLLTVTDTATIESTGDIALGQYDSLTLIGSGVKWYQVAASNN